jgi:hypothetical protein
LELRYDNAMTVEYFERDYGHLPDSEDAHKVLGHELLEGCATVGEIREEIRRGNFSKDASIKIHSDRCKFYIDDLKTDFRIA